jgi:hypothetical protein
MLRNRPSARRARDDSAAPLVRFAITVATLPVTASSQSPERLKPVPGYTLSWDQGKVAVLTRQLANSAAEIRRDFGKQPVPEVGSKESRTYLILSDDLRLIESESGELAERIAKGASADESYPPSHGGI